MKQVKISSAVVGDFGLHDGTVKRSEVDMEGSTGDAVVLERSTLR